MTRATIAAFIVLLAPACEQRSSNVSVSVTRTLGPVILRVTADGAVFFNEEPVSLEELERRFVAMAEQPDSPTIHIVPDQAAKYGDIAHVMAAAMRHGLIKKTGVIGGT